MAPPHTSKKKVSPQGECSFFYLLLYFRRIKGTSTGWMGAAPILGAAPTLGAAPILGAAPQKEKCYQVLLDFLHKKEEMQKGGKCKKSGILVQK